MDNIVGEIRKLNAESTESDIMRIVEFDFKDNEVVEKNSNPLEKYFAWKSKENRTDREKDNASSELYKELNWVDEKSFDIIDSFINIYAFALLIFFPNDFKLVKKYNSVIVANSNKFQFANSSKYLTDKENGEKRYSTFKEINELECIRDLARLTHSFGNFMPCPGPPYNSAKGLCNEIKDFLDLMLTKIDSKDAISYSEKKKDENGKSVYKIKDVSTYKTAWNKWFEGSMEKIVIQKKDYQLFNDIKVFEKIKKDEFVKLVSNINNRIRIRGLRILKEITDCQEVKNKCCEIIEKTCKK